jgi:hypothetical protein
MRIIQLIFYVPRNEREIFMCIISVCVCYGLISYFEIWHTRHTVLCLSSFPHMKISALSRRVQRFSFYFLQPHESERSSPW